MNLVVSPIAGLQLPRTPGHGASTTELGVAHLDMLFIGGTTLITVLVNLNVAVVLFCVLFFLVSRFTTVPDREPAGDQADA